MKRLNGIVSYSGFNEPELLADSLTELIANIEIESNYQGDVTDVFTESLIDELEYNGVTVDIPIKDLTADQLDNLNAELSGYGIYIRPTISELQDFNESVMLDRNTYLTEYIGGVAL